MKAFFISYTTADERWAEWIGWQLEAAGLEVKHMAWDFRPGADFAVEMHKALQECERTLLVLSPAYLQSDFCLKEWTATFTSDPAGALRKLLPVRIADCKPGGLLAGLVYIDLVNLDEEAAKKKLLDGVQTGRAKPATAPGFPGATATAARRDAPAFPGTLPAIWNVPHLRNPNFTGRTELLAQLHNALAQRQAAALTQTLAGLGGVGKTQLALEYAYRHTDRYTLVWWLRAEQAATLAADYAALARALALPEQDEQDQSRIIAAVKQELGRRRNWLLIFDNAAQPDELRPYLPTAHTGHIIITSRHADWHSVGASCPVHLLPQAEAVQMLLKITDQKDAAAAGALATELGCLPLALEQAGAYICAGGLTLADYLALYRGHRLDLLKQGAPPAAYPDTVATTWDLAFQALDRELPAAADLLNLCAFLAPEEIPFDLLREQVAKLPKKLAATLTDDLAFNKAIAALRHYSLISRDGHQLALHRLVQAVTRDRLAAAGAQKKWATAALELVNAAFPFESDDVRTWPVCARLLGHALSAAEHGEALGVTTDATARLLNQAGLYLRFRADFAAAEPLYRRALAILEKSLGKEHPNVASALNNLAQLLQATNRLAEAEPLLRRALTISTQSLGAEHPTTKTFQENLEMLELNLAAKQPRKKS